MAIQKLIHHRGSASPSLCFTRTAVYWHLAALRGGFTIFGLNSL